MTSKELIEYLKCLQVSLEEFIENPNIFDIANVEVLVNEDYGASILDDPDNYFEHNDFEIILYFKDFDIYLRYFGESNSSMERFWSPNGRDSDWDSLIEVRPVVKEKINWEKKILNLEDISWSEIRPEIRSEIKS